MSLVLLSTKEAIFLFDVLALGEKFIFDSESPLRNILEDSGIMKVLHDSRIICDLLHHKYQARTSEEMDETLPRIWIYIVGVAPVTPWSWMGGDFLDHEL